MARRIFTDIDSDFVAGAYAPQGGPWWDGPPILWQCPACQNDPDARPGCQACAGAGCIDVTDESGYAAYLAAERKGAAGGPN